MKRKPQALASLYVLTTDPRMPSKSNLWGTQAGDSPEDASARFKVRIQTWHSPTKTGHLGRMDMDRARRLRENDFSVQPLEPA
jgi:hypothetical protein